VKERVLITVKTYPTISKKYAELVCTAGVTESGEWRRLYPVRFRQLYAEQQYQKYQWVEADIEKSTSDNRPESYKIIHDSLKTVSAPLPTKNKWAARREAFSEKVDAYDNLEGLIGRAHKNELSLALFKPKRFLKFVHKPVAREWNARKIENLEKQKQQIHLFDNEESVARQFAVVKKLPYKFSYQFEDNLGQTSTLMIEDWEIGALYWNCLRDSHGDENAAIAKVRKKYWDHIVQSGKYDIMLVLGTTLEHHRKKVSNPFVIISVFWPGLDLQERLF